MTYLVGLIIAFAFFGGLELLWRMIGLPFSIFGALGAVLRQTDEPGLQRRRVVPGVVRREPLTVVADGATVQQAAADRGGLTHPIEPPSE